MQVLIPKPITAAAFVSSTLTESEYPVWVSTTSYAVGVRVIRSHLVYESLTAGNLANDPDATSGKWNKIGPTNQWALFDDSPGTATTATTSFQVTVAPGAVADIVLAGVIGSTVNIYAGGTLVKTASIPAPSSPATSSTVKITGLSISAGTQVGVQVTGTGTVQCAMLLCGSIVDIGGTQDGASITLIDHSKKETDRYGTVTLTRRGYSRKITASVSVLAANVETVDATLRAMRATVGYWIVDSMDPFQCAGILSDWSLTIETKASSTYSATILGLSRDDAVITPGASYDVEGQDATGSGQIVLTQPAILLPADPSGVVPSFAGAACTVGVVQDGQNATAHWIITKADTGCASTLAGNIVTITAMSADSGYVDLTATRSGAPAATARISVAKAKAGVGGLSVTLGNESPMLRASSGGSVSSYSGSGCIITALDGSTALTASASATASAFRIGTISQSPAGAITVGAITYTGTTALIGQHAAMSSAVDQVILTIPVTVYRADGSSVQFVKTQTIGKAKDGANGANGTNGTSGVRGSANVSRQISGAAWSTSEAATALSANGFGAAQQTDVVTLFNPAAVPPYTETKIYLSGVWEVLAQYLNGSLLVDGTVIAQKIDSRGLSIKDANGNVILAAGSALPTAYAAPGTLNSDVAVGDNLIRKFDFSTAGVGNWGANATNTGSTSAIGLRELTVGARDTIENGNDIPVMPDERIYGGAYINTTGVSYQVGIGLCFINASGSIIDFRPVGYRAPGQAGGWVRGSITVPAGAVKASPWIQSDAFSGFGAPKLSGMYLSRSEPGATYGAPAGTMVGNTLAQNVEGNAANALTNAASAASAASAAQSSANSALGQLQAIASDGVLSRGDKQQTIINWTEIWNAQVGLVAQANAYGITAERDAYTSAVSALAAYLTSLSPGWGDTSQDTTIIPATFRANWASAYDARNALLNRIAAVAGTRADWGSVGGSGKPENNATVGARAGVNLVDSAGAALNDMAIKNSAAASGTNLVYNDSFEEGLQGWSLYGDYGVGGASLARGINLSDAWRLAPAGYPNTSVQFVQQIGRSVTDGAYIEIASDPIPVGGGKRYIVSAYTGAHRCAVDIFVYYFNASGNIGHSHGIGDYRNSEEASGGQGLSGYKRIHSIANTPAGVQYMRIILRKGNSTAGSSDSFMFFTRAQAEGVGADATTPGPWAPSGISNPTAIRNSNPISGANVATYVSPGAIGNTQIGGTISSDNYVANSTGWAISKAGTAEFAQAKFRGSIYGGAFTGWAWPAAGQTGYYLGAEGLLIGNANNNKFFQVSSDGNMYMPGMMVENGQLTISAANIINTLQIAGGAVTESFLAASGQTTANPASSLTINVPAGQTWQVTAIASASVPGSQVIASNSAGAASVTASIRYNAVVMDSSFQYGPTVEASGDGSNISTVYMTTSLQHTQAFVGPASITIDLTWSGTRCDRSRICVLATKR